MLLKKLTLYNFRQFKGTHIINFATEEKKNVTIILAENGVGKTTLAQAFQWVLYSSTDGFNDKNLLNLIVQKELPTGQTEKVKVDLVLVHEDIEYTITRTQQYRKELNGDIKIIPGSELNISYLTKDGQTDFIKDTRKNSTINNILPQSLSRYFFFDGERIEKMSSEIKNGKSKEFSEAVQGLLGLTALLKTIEHLNPRTSDSVIGRYNKEIDQFGDQKTRELRESIYSIESFLEKATERIEELDSDIVHYKDKREKTKLRISEFAEAERSQNLLNRLEDEVKREEKHKTEITANFLNHFSRNTTPFFSTTLIQKALEELKSADAVDKGIPDIRDKTIEFLLKRKKCICGCDLSEQTSAPVQHLMEELKYLPPNSLGTMISNFVKDSKRTITGNSTYYTTSHDYFFSIRNTANIINEKEDEISEIDKSLLKNSNARIADLKIEQTDTENTLRKCESEKRELEIQVAIKIKEKEAAEKKISEYQLIDARNKKIEIERQYALAVYEKVKATYDYQENQVREKLEQSINALFKQIYADGMSISIDDKYNIKVYVNELEDFTTDVDRSTAQSYSVIFAFIVGIIDMAKAKKSENENLVDTEAYPLVMDAPLSAFDEKRIGNICNVIPGIAKQVIMIIKDTDGNKAKIHMGYSIGKEYQLKTRDNTSLVDTYVEEVSL
ncbi:MAG: AAA family ATPase [Clostridia bacterium]|nr:AAA family ATPase [Clostridia bacterium]